MDTFAALQFLAVLSFFVKTGKKVLFLASVIEKINSTTLSMVGNICVAGGVVLYSNSILLSWMEYES